MTATLQPSQINIDAIVAAYQLSGERKDLEVLLGRIYPLIYGACLNNCKHQEDAKDITVTVCINLAEKLQGTNIDNFNSWLFSVCNNACADFYREKTKENKEAAEFIIWQKSQDNYIENEVIAAIDQEEDTSSTSTNIEEKELQRLVALLPNDQRQCIQLFYFKRMSYQQICNKSNYDMKHVKTALQNGRRKLKKMMEGNR